MLDKLLKILTSLKLTVACLCLALGLVFFGTLAQVKWGLWIIQEKYFNSWFVYWEPNGWNIPVWPGGYLLGTLLLINLIAAHVTRFQFTRKKFGIFTIHAGIILLLVGQLFTSLLQVETYMTIPEGERKNYSESSFRTELAIVDITDEETDSVVAIPQSILASKKEIEHEALPFTIQVEDYTLNSKPTVVQSGGEKQIAFLPIGQALALNEQNLPAAKITIQTDEGVKGPFTLSRWLADRPWRRLLEKELSDTLSPGFTRAPTFSYKGREYRVALRPERHYKPFHMQLLDFTHERYPGTDIPKDYSSRVRITNPETSEDREVLIYMNNPLRYAGETYYQGGFEPGDTVTILQVVRNPTWLTPYIACSLVALGLVVQFLSHLISFAKKKRSA